MQNFVQTIKERKREIVIVAVILRYPLSLSLLQLSYQIRSYKKINFSIKLTAHPNQKVIQPRKL